MSEATFTLALPDAVVETIARRAADIVLAQLATASEWMTSAEAAEYLRCTRGRIHNLVSEGRLPHHKDGGRLLFRRSELDAYVTGGAVPT